MKKALVDTDVVSYFVKGLPIRAKYVPHLENRELCLSIVSWGEMQAGVKKKNWGPAKLYELERHLARFAIVNLDMEIALTF